jgi:hypothetical protein
VFYLLVKQGYFQNEARQTSCGFKSRHRHQPSPPAQRVAKAVAPKVGAKADVPSNDSAASARQASKSTPEFLVLFLRREYFAVTPSNGKFFTVV